VTATCRHFGAAWRVNKANRRQAEMVAHPRLLIACRLDQAGIGLVEKYQSVVV
jgi:hypothetical protein